MLTITDIRRAILRDTLGDLCGEGTPSSAALAESLGPDYICALDDGRCVAWGRDVPIPGVGRSKREIVAYSDTETWEVIWSEDDIRDPLPGLLRDNMITATGAVGATLGPNGNGGQWCDEDTIRSLGASGYYCGWIEVPVSPDEIARHFRDAGAAAPDELATWRAWDSPDGTERIYVWE